MKLNRLLWGAISGPAAFVVGATLLSFLPHTEGLRSHGQEHIALALTLVAGIIPFSFLMIRIFRRIQHQILVQNQELSSRNREIQALLKVGRAVENSLELDTVLPATSRAILEATTVEAAEVWIVNRDDESLSLRHHYGDAREAFLEITRFERGHGYPGIVAESGSPILVHDLWQDRRFLRQKVKDEGFQTFYAVPLKQTGETIGVLAVAARAPSALSSGSEL